MNELSRRQFFSYLAGKAAERAHRALVSAARTTRALEPRPRGSVKCARCFAPFDPVADESLCATCREIETKQQSLIAAWSDDQ
jgi:hypothetical protein